ncbi:MAG: SigB/SigF/SigG family RNA polymerase sigma factor [Lachnospiraceae bacterium]|nr:SigB/SigF/SigG family RNA polymerase sigma factor [Lachnospiraceae bacterium]
METCKLIQLWKNGDKAARDKMVEINMGLVYSIAKRFVGRGTELEDLIQIGSIGLIKAIDNFDTNYNVKFSTYAVPVITGEIKRFIRDDGMIKVSRSIKENLIKINRSIEYLRSENGIDATIEEIENCTGLNKEEIIMALDASKGIESTNEIIYNKDGSALTLQDKLKDERDEYKKVRDNMLLKSLMDKLDDFQRQIISLRYFEDKTQTEVAKILQISQVQVSRLEKKILLYMRQCT